MKKESVMTCFEFPISEHIRSWLRLEYLYNWLFYFIDCKESFAHHAALQTLFELLETASRADIKADLLQKLERQKSNVSKGDESSGSIVSDRGVEDINAVSIPLHRLTKFGEDIRKNEWLMLLKQRFSMPGGSCQFDLPTYFLWQQKSFLERRSDLEGWTRSLLPVADAVAFLLRILRSSGVKEDHLAKGGFFQKNTQDQSVQLLQLYFQKELKAVPELSANKYMLNIRFIRESTTEMRAPLLKQDIPFTLVSCKL